MIFLITLLITSSLLLISLVANWHAKVKLQLDLDTCVAEVTRELKQLQNSIESSNLRMKSLRISITAAIDPRIQAALKLWLKAEKTAQDLQKTRWEIKRAAWLVKRGCDSIRGIPSPLPHLLWNRPPADAIGDHPLQWLGERKNARLKIMLFKKPRYSVAEVFYFGKNWNATWTSPY